MQELCRCLLHHLATMLLQSVFFSFALVAPTFGQQIYDSYTTTWDKTKLFTYLNAGATPVNFNTPGADGSAVIGIQDGTVYQQMDGFGASLTDSSAGLLNNMKVCSSC